MIPIINPLKNKLNKINKPAKDNKIIPVIFCAWLISVLTNSLFFGSFFLLLLIHLMKFQIFHLI